MVMVCRCVGASSDARRPLKDVVRRVIQPVGDRQAPGQRVTWRPLQMWGTWGHLSRFRGFLSFDSRGRSSVGLEPKHGTVRYGCERSAGVRCRGPWLHWPLCPTDPGLLG